MSVGWQHTCICIYCQAPSTRLFAIAPPQEGGYQEIVTEHIPQLLWNGAESFSAAFPYDGNISPTVYPRSYPF